MQKMDNGIKEMSIKEWLAMGRAKFGPDPKDWLFVCPNCKGVQSIGDFIKLRELGIFEGNPQAAYYSCIGRYDTRIPEDQIGTLTKDPKSPCDYTSGGLLCLAKTRVIQGDGSKQWVFEFADPDQVIVAKSERRRERS